MPPKDDDDLKAYILDTVERLNLLAKRLEEMVDDPEEESHGSD